MPRSFFMCVRRDLQRAVAELRCFAFLSACCRWFAFLTACCSRLADSLCKELRTWPSGCCCCGSCLLISMSMLRLPWSAGMPICTVLGMRTPTRSLLYVSRPCIPPPPLPQPPPPPHPPLAPPISPPPPLASPMSPPQPPPPQPAPAPEPSASPSSLWPAPLSALLSSSPKIGSPPDALPLPSPLPSPPMTFIPGGNSIFITYDSG
mmetsp:Transcript_32778/g.60212  ORF Transcript_32778/g.60212 Transcript_32778/m.60212 type:complete len:206 (-) Transcript_32778:322-939(-)